MTDLQESLSPIKVGIDALFENVASGTGGLTYLRQIVRHLSLLEINRQVRWCVFASPSSGTAYDYPEVELINCGKRSESTFGRILSQQVTIPRLASRKGLSCLFCPGNVIPVLTNIPTVLVIQNRLQFNHPPALGLGRRIYRRMLSILSVRRASHIIAVSQDTAKYLIESIKVPEHKVSVVYEGIDWKPPLPDQRLPSPVKYPYILNVSTLLDYKNHETLIRAFGLLLQDKALADYHLVNIGSDWGGRKSRLKQLAVQLGISKSVVFSGHINRDQLLPYYQNASVFVYPSLVESFGLPVLEAMSQGAPVVASDRTAIPEIVGDAALIVNAEDPVAIASAINTFLNDESIRSEFIARGYRRASTFDWAESARQIYKILVQASFVA